MLDQRFGPVLAGDNLGTDVVLAEGVRGGGADGGDALAGDATPPEATLAEPAVDHGHAVDAGEHDPREGGEVVQAAVERLPGDRRLDGDRGRFEDPGPCIFEQRDEALRLRGCARHDDRAPVQRAAARHDVHLPGSSPATSAAPWASSDSARPRPIVSASSAAPAVSARRTFRPSSLATIAAMRSRVAPSRTA